MVKQEHRFDDIHTAVDTCEWLLEDAKYQAWMKATTGLFWVKGDPGTGKSVLMKHSIKRMRERSPDDLVISFFFHGQGTPLQKTLLGLFRALLASMLEHFPEPLTQLAAKFAERDKRYGRSTEGRWQWTEKELQELLSDVLTKGTYRRSVVIFIDALDECGEGPAKTLLAFFKVLTQQAEHGHARFKVCLSSRHYPILALETIPSVQVEKRNGQDIRRYVQERLRDIRPHSKREQIETEILSKSNGGFQWVLLVTGTIIDKNLIGIRAEKLLEELTSCPKTLSETYDAILNGLSAANQHQMTKLFQWVLFAERPLSAQELRDALAADKDMSYGSIFDLRASESWSDTLSDFERYIKHISGGLIHFQSREMWEQYEPHGEDSDREAQLIHQSVADYLMNKLVDHDGHRSPPVLSPAGAGHFQISRSCLRYMTLKDTLDGAHLPRGTLSSKFPLAPYAVRFLFTHIQKVEREGINQTDLTSVIQWAPDSKTMRKLESLWRTLDPDSVHTPLGWPFVGATTLHVSVAFGSMSAVDILLESGCDEINTTDADGNTPLMLAIREGHQSIAWTLLNQSVKREVRHDQKDNAGGCIVNGHPVVRAADVHAQNEDGDTALDIALDQKMDAVILELIEAGAEGYLGRETELLAHAVKSRNTKLLSIMIERNLNLDGAVFFALEDRLSRQDPGLERVVLQLLNAGANTARSSELSDTVHPEDYNEDEEDKDDGRHDNDALALASRRGLTSVVEMLLTHHAPVTSRNNVGECPLLIATRNGHEEIVQMLLRKAPSSVEIASEEGCTALEVAFDNDRLNIAGLLLRDGSFSSSDQLLEEGFLSFARNGRADIVATILQRQLLEPEVSDGEGRTPLSLAAGNGQVAVIKLLLDTGKVDINAEDENGQTPLSLAAENGYEAVVKQMLNAERVNADAKDESGRTPMSWCAANGHKAVVEQLLHAAKVNVDSIDHAGWTPLSWAAENGHQAVVKLLLDTGKVNADSIDKNGRTPLSWAAVNGHEAVVEQLLGTGKVNANLVDKSERTPLSWAAASEHKVVVKSLLDTGCVDVNVKDINGTTPVLWAVRNRCKENVELLLATGKANTCIEDNDGWTPLSWAIKHKEEALVQLLQSYCWDSLSHFATHELPRAH
ncbi:hypothetical protein SLS59_006859 [Nothophoma quercina]|uniref:Nephrocystin 3-like N-terminal domain-containing protein n=1 Tax=Nothophoma quercina TaxID=749835 RepID=A0ABR3R3K5_9PLEO